MSQAVARLRRSKSALENHRDRLQSRLAIYQEIEALEAKLETYELKYGEHLAAPILAAVCSVWGISHQALLGQSRETRFSDPRQVAMEQVHKRINAGLVRIGRMFQRDHGTVTHAIKAVESKKQTDPKFREKYEVVESLLKSKI